MKRLYTILGKIIKVGCVIALVLLFFVPGSPIWTDYVEEYLMGEIQVLDNQWYWNGSKVSSLAACEGTADENNEVHLTTTLTEDMVVKGGLLFRTAQQTLEVYVDEELIFEYNPLDTQPFGELAPPKWNYIFLPEDSVGEEISLVVHSPIAKYASNIQEIRSGEIWILKNWVFQSYFPAFMSTLFLISSGILLVTLTLFSKGFRWMRLAGLFTIAMGVWGIGESKFIDFVFGGNYIWYVMTFEAILFGVYLYTAFICNFIKKNVRNFNLWIEKVALGNLILQNALYFSGTFEFMEMLPLSHILMVLIAIVNIYYINYYKRSWNISETYIKKFMYVQGIYFTSLLIELGLFFLGDYRYTGYIFRNGVSLYIIGVAALSLQVVLERTKQTAKLSDELLGYRVAIARSQIKPHFIFNTLTSIRTLIKIDPEQAYQLVGMFSKYLRVNMSSFESNALIGFSEEIKHIRTYVEIEKVRFGSNRISVVYDIKDADFSIPSLSIQPLVENAIKHGICKKANGGVVTLRSYETKKTHVVEVVDTGVGFLLEELEEKMDSVGISNVRFRLQTLVDAEVTIKSDIGKGTKVRIIIPKEVR